MADKDPMAELPKMDPVTATPQEGTASQESGSLGVASFLCGFSAMLSLVTLVASWIIALALCVPLSLIAMITGIESLGKDRRLSWLAVAGLLLGGTIVAFVVAVFIAFGAP